MFLVSLQEKVIAMKEEKKGASWDVSAQSGYMFVTYQEVEVMVAGLQVRRFQHL